MTLTLGRSVGFDLSDTVTLPASGLTQAQVDARVVSGALQPGDITAGTNITITTTTDGLTINAAGGGGGGGGDITAVTTGGNSGLAGGANSGAAGPGVRPGQLQTHTVVDSGDLFPFADVSGTGAPPANITYRNLAADLADVGIGAGSDGLHLEVSEVPAVTSLQGGDEIPIADDSQSNDDTRKVTLATLAGHLAGTNITASADGVLSATGGGGGGASTFTALSDTPSAITASECVQGNAAGDALVFAACATGGGAATSEQRVESVTFADVDNITSTATTLTLAATTPIAVEFGDGAASMLTGTAGETTFTIADSGVYLIEFDAVYPADGDRATPFIEIQQDSDDAVIGSNHERLSAQFRLSRRTAWTSSSTCWRRRRSRATASWSRRCSRTRTTRTASTRTPAS